MDSRSHGLSDPFVSVVSNYGLLAFQVEPRLTCLARRRLGRDPHSRAGRNGSACSWLNLTMELQIAKTVQFMYFRPQSKHDLQHWSPRDHVVGALKSTPPRTKHTLLLKHSEIFVEPAPSACKSSEGSCCCAATRARAKHFC